MTGTTRELWRVPEASVDASCIGERAAELVERLQAIVAEFRDVRFASSMAAEDMVVIDAIVTARLGITIFTLDTGRLHDETVQMTARTEAHYGVDIHRVRPQSQDVASFVDQYGVNGFYDSELAKKACCHVRKVVPLNQALHGADAWLTGQRRQQAVTRTELDLREHDSERGMTKFNPIHDWTDAQVWAYLQHRQVPIHPLHDRGYPSLGCEPCTRAIRADEEIRAGRWWWLQQENKECGLHIK